MTVSEGGIAVTQSATRFRRRTNAANILVAIAGLALAFMAAADWYLVIQLNPVTRFFILGLIVFAGWFPVALVIIAVCLRPYWVTFIALGVVGVAILAMFVVFYAVPDAHYPYPEISWPHRGSA